MPDTQSNEISQFFDGTYFRLPDYQRGYSWKEKHVEDLLKDIEYVIESDERINHYIGTVVLYRDKNKKKKKHLIDGQQRVTTITLLVKSIIDELNFIYEKLDSTNFAEKEELKERITNNKRRIKRKYIRRTNKLRYKPDSRQTPVYKKIMSENENDPNVEAAEPPSHTNLIRNKKKIDSWVSGRRSKYSGRKNKKLLREWLDEIEEIIETIGYSFTVTTYRVEGETQAGRLFSVLNDRGKELNIAEKIKSYLVYQCSRMDEQELTKEVYKTFKRVCEEIAGRYGTDADIDDFMTIHWKMFTKGNARPENEPIIRIIKEREGFLADNRNEASKKMWIETYIKSLEESIKPYRKLMNPYDYIDINPETADKIYAIQEFASDRNTRSFLLSLVKNLDTEDNQTTETIKTLEKFCLTTRAVCSKTRTLKRVLVEFAGELEWINSDSKYSKIFEKPGENHATHKKERRLRRYREEIKSRREEDAQELMQSNDLIRGSTEGWGGVKDSTLRYILYEYEIHLREEKNSPGIEAKDALDSNSVSLEHISPKDENISNLENYEENINSFGNFALLETDINKKAGNKRFRKKITDDYPGSEYEQIKRLGEKQISSWSSENIKERGRNLLEFFVGRWLNTNIDNYE